MRDLVHAYIQRNIDRRGFLKGMATAGFSIAAAESVLSEDARRHVMRCRALLTQAVLWRALPMD